ncbi:hypothetical protein OBBRIDRAFT_306240 [Obba rivulosa]|uniref:Uncharacterized protein n=1 Tax=Obba rivulosa TaxID=1052685 RepID=A0A8E2J2W5_9APHY|nr:hypothetical protein OBBRIDRAFT_306240 [Obba rivulosa]
MCSRPAAAVAALPAGNSEHPAQLSINKNQRELPSVNPTRRASHHVPRARDIRFVVLRRIPRYRGAKDARSMRQSAFVCSHSARLKARDICRVATIRELPPFFIGTV